MGKNTKTVIDKMVNKGGGRCGQSKVGGSRWRRTYQIWQARRCCSQLIRLTIVPRTDAALTQLG
jgi:hypothetical protein